MSHAALLSVSHYFKVPIQSTLESLAQGVIESFLTCNIEFAVTNIFFYISRSFNSGKHLRVLTKEIEALARQHENVFSNNMSSDSPVRGPLLQLYLASQHNALHDFQEDNRIHGIREPFCLDKVQVVDNYDLLKLAFDQEQFACVHAVLSYQIAKEFIFRNMDSALKCADLYLAHFLVSQTLEFVSGLCLFAIP